MAPSRRKRSNASLSGSTGALLCSLIARRAAAFRSALPVYQSWSGVHLKLILLATSMNGRRGRVHCSGGGEGNEHIVIGSLVQAIRRQCGRELRTVLRPSDRNALRKSRARRGRATAG